MGWHRALQPQSRRSSISCISSQNRTGTDRLPDLGNIATRGRCLPEGSSARPEIFVGSQERSRHVHDDFFRKHLKP